MDERPFRFYIPTPGPRWLFISLIVVCLLTAVWLFLDDFAGGAYVALASALLLAPAAAGSFRSHLEISSDARHIRFVPSSLSRVLGAASVTSREVSRGSELLLCERRSYGLFDEHAIVVRGPDGDDETVWSGMAHSGFSHRRAAELGEAVARRFGWPVRLLVRERDQNGWTEREWLPPKPVPARVWVPLAIGSTLPLAGIPIRLLTANRAYIFWAGIALWLVVMGLRTYLFRSAQEKTEFPAEYFVSLLTGTINFAIFYFLAIVLISLLAEHSAGVSR